MLEFFCFSANLAQIWHRDSNLETDSYFDSKGGFLNNFKQFDAKTSIFYHFFGQTPLGKSVTMATTKVSGN